MKNLEKLIDQYQSLKIEEIFDYNRFNQYSIVHHSTRIEGSTLTQQETYLLLSDNLTPKGKPLTHSLMVKNHFEALTFILENKDKSVLISPDFLKSINAKVLFNTSSIYETVLGIVDAGKGEYRKGNVSAGVSFFPNYDKLESMTQKLCEQINQKLGEVLDLKQKIYLCFDAHFDLVSIHPWYDGNGRTSRLLMNFLQNKLRLPLSIVFEEDKQDYYQALVDSRKNEDLAIFRNFMKEQYSKFLMQEIEKYKNMKSSKGGKGFSFVF